MEALGDRVKDFKLTPGRGGSFELTVDGKPVYSKLQTGQFPNDEELAEQVAKM